MEYIAMAGPVIQIINGRRPDLQPDVAEVTGQGTVMGTIKVYTVAEHAGLTVRNMLPQGQNRIRHMVIPFCRISIECVLIIPAHAGFDQPQQACRHTKSQGGVPPQAARD